MKLRKNALLLLSVPLSLFFSCKKGTIANSVHREDLFSLNYGIFEDEINVYDLSSPSVINTKIKMNDGFFYVLNGESKKIMELNSYGDLLSLYYNSDANPVPSFLNESSEDDVSTSTKGAIQYPFNELSLLAVDSRKYLYAVEKLPLERQEYDEKYGQTVNHVVLCFDENKKFVKYIGQQGPGGSPFPYIKNIYATDRNELVVISATSQGTCAYWFSPDGFLMYTVPIDGSSIPNPYADDKTEVYFNLDNVVPDYRDRKLYMKVDYYSSYIDESSHVQSGIQYISTLIHVFNIEKAEYERTVVIPPCTESVAEGFSKESHDYPYDFLGVTENGWMFFILSIDDGFSIQMVQADGQKILQRKLQLNREENFYYTFDLSRTGIISAMLVQKDKAYVSWWRIDSLIQAVIRK